MAASVSENSVSWLLVSRPALSLSGSKLVGQQLNSKKQEAFEKIDRAHLGEVTTQCFVFKVAKPSKAKPHLATIGHSQQHSFSLFGLRRMSFWPASDIYQLVLGCSLPVAAVPTYVVLCCNVFIMCWLIIL